MKPKTIILIFVAVFISAFIITFLLKIRQKAPSTASHSPTPQSFVTKFKSGFPIIFSVTESQFIFPKKLSSLEFSSSETSLTKDFFAGIANRLNFQGEPQIIADPIDGTTYFWKNEGHSFFAYTRSRKINYNSAAFNPSSDNQLSDDSILTIAKDFIVNNNILGANSFQTGAIKFMKEDRVSGGFAETTKQQAILFQVPILPKAVNYEIISPSATTATSYIQIQPDGSINSFQVIFFPDFKNGDKQYALKNYQEVKSSLSEATLIEAKTQMESLSDITPDSIEEVEINKIEIAYLMESPSSIVFQPVYKLSGEARLKNDNQKIIVTFYLSAISDKQP